MIRGQPRRRVARQITYKPLVDGAKKAFDFPASPWHARFRKDEYHGQIGAHLLQMHGGKITAMVGIERRRNPCDLPVWHSLTPNGLAQCQGRLDGRGSLQAEPETGNGPAVII